MGEPRWMGGHGIGLPRILSAPGLPFPESTPPTHVLENQLASNLLAWPPLGMRPCSESVWALGLDLCSNPSSGPLDCAFLDLLLLLLDGVSVGVAFQGLAQNLEALVGGRHPTEEHWLSKWMPTYVLNGRRSSSSKRKPPRDAPAGVRKVQTPHSQWS